MDVYNSEWGVIEGPKGPDSSAGTKSNRWWGAVMYPKQRKDTVRISSFRKMNLAGLWKDQLGGKTTSGKLYSYLRRNPELEWSW